MASEVEAYYRYPVCCVEVVVELNVSLVLHSVNSRCANLNVFLPTMQCSCPFILKKLVGSPVRKVTFAAEKFLPWFLPCRIVTYMPAPSSSILLFLLPLSCSPVKCPSFSLGKRRAFISQKPEGCWGMKRGERWHTHVDDVIGEEGRGGGPVKMGFLQSGGGMRRGEKGQIGYNYPLSRKKTSRMGEQGDWGGERERRVSILCSLLSLSLCYVGTVRLSNPLPSTPLLPLSPPCLPAKKSSGKHSE